MLVLETRCQYLEKLPLVVRGAMTDRSRRRKAGNSRWIIANTISLAIEFAK